MKSLLYKNAGSRPSSDKACSSFVSQYALWCSTVILRFLVTPLMRFMLTGRWGEFPNGPSMRIKAMASIRGDLSIILRSCATFSCIHFSFKNVATVFIITVYWFGTLALMLISWLLLPFCSSLCCVTLIIGILEFNKMYSETFSCSILFSLFVVRTLWF